MYGGKASKAKFTPKAAEHGDLGNNYVITSQFKKIIATKAALDFHSLRLLGVDSQNLVSEANKRLISQNNEKMNMFKKVTATTVTLCFCIWHEFIFIYKNKEKDMDRCNYHILRLLPSWHCPGWSQSSLSPVQQAASRASRPDSEPDERGSWIWRASPAHQGLSAGHVHPSKQQFPKQRH